jgi:uncharacterized protein (TIGR03437 family)
MKRIGKDLPASAVFVLCAATAIALPAQTFTRLYSFDGTDGVNPQGVLVQAANGDLYGTTLSGGQPGGAASGIGTIFKIAPTGALTTLHSFDGMDGASPFAGLVQATNGDFYGTTFGGGANCPPYGCGTIFKITPSGTLTTLYSFCSSYSSCSAGELPIAGLVQATDGDFYGTTDSGGADFGTGTVFKMTPAGTLTTLHSFDSTDGASPFAALIQAADGNFYGTTYTGGANCAETFGCGTVFKISPGGTLTTLYNFCTQSGCPDGAGPYGIVQAANGDLYGTTEFGGTSGPNNCTEAFGCGTIFKITPGGTLTTLHSFCSLSGCADGENPVAGLVQATDGNLYGTTGNGGANNNPACWGNGTSQVPTGCGTVFRITPGGTLTTLYSFCSQTNCTDGNGPAGLIQANNGDLYGTTDYGGANGDGTVFSLSVGLGPSAPAVNPGGVLNSASYTTQGVAPGSIVSIFGTNLAASTAAANTIPLPTSLGDVASVTFNSIPAGLYFVSQNQINAQVPFNVLQGSTVNIAVTRSSGTSAPQNVTVALTSPGIFTTNANGLGQAFAYDNTTGVLAAPVGAPIGSLATAPISLSSGQALIIACTGLGSVTPSIDNYVAAPPVNGQFYSTVLTPTVLIGGVPAALVYSVLSPQFVSEYQIGVIPAANTPTGNAVPIQIQVGGVTTTDQVTIAVAP